MECGMDRTSALRPYRKSTVLHGDRHEESDARDSLCPCSESGGTDAMLARVLDSD